MLLVYSNMRSPSLTSSTSLLSTNSSVSSAPTFSSAFIRHFTKLAGGDAHEIEVDAVRTQVHRDKTYEHSTGEWNLARNMEMILEELDRLAVEVLRKERVICGLAQLNEGLRMECDGLRTERDEWEKMYKIKMR